MPYLKTIFEELEDQLARASVLGILNQLEDEVRALAVQVSEQIEDCRVPAVPRDVLRTDLLVISGHRRHPTGLPGIGTGHQESPDLESPYPRIFFVYRIYKKCR